MGNSSTKAAVAALAGAALLATTARAGVTVTTEWVFNGVAAESYDMRPGETVTVGMRVSWFDPDGRATAFGALNDAEITITGATGIREGDAIANVTRVAPFDFGPDSLDGLVTSKPEGFLISGVGPAQSQFAAFEDTGNPSGVIWQFEFTAGRRADRTIALDLESLENALLFVVPFDVAIDVGPESVRRRTGFLHVIPIPSPAALALLGAALLAPRRGRPRR